MKRDILVYIADILECIAKIEEYTKTITEDDFYENSQILPMCHFSIPLKWMRKIHLILPKGQSSQCFISFN